MNFCISYFEDISVAFNEANRVLKKNGFLIVSFIDKKSIIGISYEQHKKKCVFYKDAKFYTEKNMISELTKAGFRKFEFVQTLFHRLDEINEFEAPKYGYGEGSFITIKTIKNH